jgi:hypothetical protein
MDKEIETTLAALRQAVASVIADARAETEVLRQALISHGTGIESLERIRRAVQKEALPTLLAEANKELKERFCRFLAKP